VVDTATLHYGHGRKPCPDFAFAVKYALFPAMPAPDCKT
jgi:hypothetical protein